MLDFLLLVIDLTENLREEQTSKDVGKPSKIKFKPRIVLSPKKSKVEEQQIDLEMSVEEDRTDATNKKIAEKSDSDVELVENSDVSNEAEAATKDSSSNEDEELLVIEPTRKTRRTRNYSSTEKVSDKGNTGNKKIISKNVESDIASDKDDFASPVTNFRTTRSSKPEKVSDKKSNHKKKTRSKPTENDSDSDGEDIVKPVKNVRKTRNSGEEKSPVKRSSARNKASSKQEKDNSDEEKETLKRKVKKKDGKRSPRRRSRRGKKQSDDEEESNIETLFVESDSEDDLDEKSKKKGRQEKKSKDSSDSEVRISFICFKIKLTFPPGFCDCRIYTEFEKLCRICKYEQNLAENDVLSHLTMLFLRKFQSLFCTLLHIHLGPL